MYRLTLQSKAQKFLNKLDKSNQTKIIKSLKKIKQNPYSGKPLVGKLSGLFTKRIEKYRVIYQIFEGKCIVLVINIGHRKNVYHK